MGGCFGCAFEVSIQCDVVQDTHALKATQGWVDAISGINLAGRVGQDAEDLYGEHD